MAITPIGETLRAQLLAQNRDRQNQEKRQRSAGGQQATDFRSLRSDIMRDPNWTAMFESLRGAKVAGGASAEGSNQIRGVEGDLRGRPSLSALQSIGNDPYSSFHDNASFGPESLSDRQFLADQESMYTPLQREASKRAAMLKGIR